jgi:hypothetical protein
VAQAVISNNKKTIVFLGRTIGRYTIYPLSFFRLLVVNSAETAFKPLPLGAENGQCTALVHDIPPARAWGCVHDLHWPHKQFTYVQNQQKTQFVYIKCNVVCSLSDCDCCLLQIGTGPRIRNWSRSYENISMP